MTQSDPNKFSQGEKVVSSIVKTLPNKPGVYRMLDDTGSVLYVGKAKNLKNRVSSYSRVTGHSLRIGRMISYTLSLHDALPILHSFPTRRSSDQSEERRVGKECRIGRASCRERV